MADADDRRTSAQVWGSAVVVGSALAVVAAYLINGALLVLAVAGAETLLLMVYVARRWRALHGGPAPARRHRPRRGTPDAAHCERCRRAREALDARQARARSMPAGRPESPVRTAPAGSRRGAGRGPHREPDAAQEPHRGSGEPRREAYGEPHREYGESRGHGEHHHVHESLQGPVAQSEPGAADHSPYLRGPQLRAPYERPWTAERAAARSVDRSTARRGGAPGSAGRAVRHQ
ncbi:hypothetical protein ACFRAR_18210 [Kitasatospora sp. NPDC056651]|uniref:hypothetical protein n=1 Tax=Kitasatospora sp. NPDC056651 TaxID=3345892 RepID=UPI0036821411